jgi:hypothetical protein
MTDERVTSCVQCNGPLPERQRTRRRYCNPWCAKAAHRAGYRLLGRADEGWGPRWWLCVRCHSSYEGDPHCRYCAPRRRPADAMTTVDKP